MKKFIALGDTTTYISRDSDDDLSDQETLTPFQEDVSEFIKRDIEGGSQQSIHPNLQKSENFTKLLIKAVCTQSVVKLFWIPMGTCTPSDEQESEFCMKLYDLSCLVRDYCPLNNYKFVSFLLLAKSLENLYPTELSTDFIVKATSLYPKLEKPGSVENLISSIISKFKPLTKDPGALIKALTLLYQTAMS